MKLHERTLMVQRAGLELSGHMLDVVHKYGLTYGEVLSLLAAQASRWSTLLIRTERHPDDPEKRADEE